MVLTLSLFFLAMFYQDRISGPQVLIFPFLVLSALFFIGYAKGGGIVKSGFKYILWYLIVLVPAILFALLLRYSRAK